MRRLCGAGLAALTVAITASAVAYGASSPTLTASNHVAGMAAIDYKQSIALSGHESASGTRSYALQAKAWPFTGSYHTVASGTTTGNYSVAVLPSHATRYRVVVGGQTSPALTVYVIWQTLSDNCNLCVGNNSPGTHTLIINARFRAPPGPIAVMGPVYFYYGQINGSRVSPTMLHLVKTVPLHVSGHRLSVDITYTVNFPSGMPFEFSTRYCWRNAESKDGVGLRGHHHCGDATINPNEYLG